MVKKFVSLLLAMIMVLSMLSTIAFGAVCYVNGSENEYFDTISDAINSRADKKIFVFILLRIQIKILMLA